MLQRELKLNPEFGRQVCQFPQSLTPTDIEDAFLHRLNVKEGYAKPNARKISASGSKLLKLFRKTGEDRVLVIGIQESTMRAAVADLVPDARRGSAYGIFTAVYGLAWLAGSIIIGATYERSVVLTAVVVTVVPSVWA